MLYPLLRSLLFTLPPEAAHSVALKSLQLARIPAAGALRPLVAADPVQLMGLTLPNRIGLAAGLDKNGEYIDALAALGFGFIEIGTVTPKPQDGNPRPRLFRLPGQRALINRMGFNNKGIDHLLAQVKQSHYRGILGINIGKNKNTPADRSIDDYLECMKKAYSVASYIAINISSPNTPGLRDLQNTQELAPLLAELTRLRKQLIAQSGRDVPLVVKVAPDLLPPQIEAIAQAVADQAIDGLIVSNTTVGRAGVEGEKYAAETGGMSGAPLMAPSTAVLRAFAQRLPKKVVLIGVGGILDAADAVAKIKAGAQLVQVYSGFIYRGPGLIREISKALKQLSVNSEQ
jgi:dihydroorotate dehydrogenase